MTSAAAPLVAVLLLGGGVPASPAGHEPASHDTTLPGASSLVVALADPHPEFRRFAAWTLARRDPPPSDAPTLSALANALSDGDPHVSGYAADALVHAGAPAVPYLISLLASPDGPAGAEDTLARIGAPAVPGLIAALDELATPDDDVADASRIVPLTRVWSILGAIGPAAEPATGRLAETVRRATDRFEGIPAATALGRIGGPAVPALLDILRKATTAETREYAAHGLGIAGPAAAAAVGDLTAVLAGDRDGRVRFTAAQALGEIGRAAASALPVLIDTLHRDPSETVRIYAAWSLGRVAPQGAPAAPAIAALVAVLGDADEKVATRAVDALQTIGAAAEPSLTRALVDTDARVRIHAARALGGCPGARRSIDALIAAFSDADEDVRDAAADALAALGQAAAPRLTATIADPRPAASVDSSIDPRGYAVLALARMKPPLDSALPTLIEAIDAPGEDAARLRRLAIWSMSAYGERAMEALDPLVAALDDPDVATRRTAAWSIGNIGPAARQIAEAPLRRIADDAEESVRVEVAEALTKLAGTYRTGGTHP